MVHIAVLPTAKAALTSLAIAANNGLAQPRDLPRISNEGYRNPIERTYRVGQENSGIKYTASTYEFYGLGKFECILLLNEEPYQGACIETDKKGPDRSPQQIATYFAQAQIDESKTKYFLRDFQTIKGEVGEIKQGQVLALGKILKTEKGKNLTIRNVEDFGNGKKNLIFSIDGYQDTLYFTGATEIFINPKYPVGLNHQQRPMVTFSSDNKVLLKRQG